MAVDRAKFIIEVDTKKGVSSLKGLNKQLAQTDKTVAGASKSLMSMGNVLKGAAFLGAIVAAKKAFDFAEQGANVARLEFAFDSMARAVGRDSKQILSDLQEMSAGTLSNFDLIQQASRAVTLGLPIDRISEMMEVSRAAAAAMGESTTRMFESIVLGTARQSRLILDNLGIMISETKVYKEETIRLGHKLSDAEKRAAFFNEVIKQGQKIIANVGDTTRLASTSFERFRAAFKNVGDGIGVFLSEPAADLLDWLTDIVKGIEEFLTASNDLTEQYQRDAIKRTAAAKEAQLNTIKAENDLVKALAMTGDERAQKHASILQQIIAIETRFEKDYQQQLEAHGGIETAETDRLYEKKKFALRDHHEALERITVRFWADNLRATDKAALLAESVADTAKKKSETHQKAVFDIRFRNLKAALDKEIAKGEEFADRFRATIARMFPDIAKELGIIKAIPEEQRKILEGTRQIQQAEFDTIDIFAQALAMKETEFQLLQTLGFETFDAEIEHYTFLRELYREGSQERLDAELKIAELTAENAEKDIMGIEDINTQWEFLNSQVGRTAQFLAGPVASGVSRMVSGVISGQRAFKGVGDMIRGIVADLAAAVVQAAILAAIMKTMGGGGFGGLFKGFLGIGKSQGGRIPEMPLYAAGGARAPSRGTDTVPAMLTPGEIVLPADISRRLATQVGELQRGNVPQQGGRTITVNFYREVVNENEFRNLVYQAVADAELA